MKGIITIVLTVLGIAFSSCQESNQIHGVANINVADFEAKIKEKDAYLIDVRTPSEIAQGYIEGANMLNISNNEFERKYKNIPKNKIIYVYCKSGYRSNKAAKFLKEKGYATIYNLDGGLDAWIKSGKPVKR